MIKKILLSMITLFIIMSSVNASLCLPFFEGSPQVSSVISVYDDTKSYIGQLSQFDNTIQENWYLKIDMSLTTDDEDNIDNERIYILSNSVQGNTWEYDFVDYDTLNFLSALGSSFDAYDFYEHFTGDTINYGGGQYFNVFVKSLNTGNVEHNTLAITELTPNSYSLLLTAADECGNVDYEFIDLIVTPTPSPTSYTCDSNDFAPSINGNYIDVYVEDDCIELNFYTQNSINNIYYTGTIYDDTNELPLEIKFYHLGMTLNMFTNSLNPVIDTFIEESINSNFNEYNIDLTLQSANFELNNHNGEIYLTMPSDEEIFLLGVNNINFTQSNTNTDYTYAVNDLLIYGTYNFNSIDSTTSMFLESSSNVRDNYFNFDTNLNAFIYNDLDKTNDNNIYLNTFENIKTLSYEESNPVSISEQYLNTYKFKFGGVIEGYTLSSVTIGKELNGVMVGNSYLDSNGDDMFTCPTDVIDVTFMGVKYFVCDSAVQVVTDVYDYIIVTDVSAGGSPPVEQPKKPTAVINIDINSPEINEQVTWDISDSYDSDGSIVEYKLYVDNVLYDNVLTDSFTSEIPDTISLTLQVTDDTGLTDTTYKTINFQDTENVCEFNNEPVPQIQATDLGNNVWTFESVNEFDVENDEILSRIWRINYEDIEGSFITSNIGYDQTIYLHIFDGCKTGSTFFTINNTGGTIDETTEPLVDLSCELSSQIPLSVLSCNIDFELLGYELESIKWYYDGSEISSQENKNYFITSVNDVEQHNVYVSVKSTQNVKSESFGFQLTDNPFYFDNETIDDEIYEEYDGGNVFGSVGEIITSDSGETADNVVGLVQGLGNGVLNVILPFGLFLFSILIIGGTLLLLS